MALRLKTTGTPRPARHTLVLLGVLVAAGAAAAFLAFQGLSPSGSRLTRLRQYWADPSRHTDWSIRAGAQCGTAPFRMPTDGLIGFLLGD
jgi:hypothetical protein